MDTSDAALLLLILGCGAWCAMIFHLAYTFWTGGY